MSTPELAAPPSGWFLVEVFRKGSRKWDWVAFMVDKDPESAPPGWLPPETRWCWVSIPGKHRNPDAAKGAFQDILATRH
jgi:hypothetical protein